jgi:heme/copper-type cytochrome/quinol oxidase subunit 2
MSLVTSVFACATCRPAPGTIAAEAQDSAVLVMLFCLAGVFSVVIGVMFNFARRQRLVLAAEAELQSVS